MKKFIALFLCLTMALSIFCTSAFAASDENDTDSEVGQTATASFSSISPFATSRGLLYKENFWFMGVQSFTVTPESGANLNIWLKNDNPVIVTVYKTNIFGLYSKVYGSVTFPAGERDVVVATNCNGKNYLVKYESAVDGSTMSTLVYQN